MSACNVCDRGCPSYPCDCPCHGSEIIAWLESADGENWSRSFHRPAETTLWDGIFGQIKEES